MALPRNHKLILAVLTFVSFVLTLVSYAAPLTKWDHSSSLITVSPQTEQGSGPIFVLGIFGSCGRADNASDFVCVSAPFAAKYDLSVLPSNIPNILLLPHFFRVLFYFALVFWIVGIFSIFASAKLLTIRKVGKFDLNDWTGVLTPSTLLSGFLIWFTVGVFFIKTAYDFNACLSLGGQTPALSAKVGSIITLIGSAYACCAGIYILSRA